MIVAVVLVAGGLLTGTWFTARMRRLPLAAGGELPSISIVIPARDEAATLPSLLGSVAAQRAAPHEVIVVDDGSTDDTASVAAVAGATVVSLDGPPPGWAGKPYACARGAEAATGDVLVFLDADVRLLPASIERLVAAHAAWGGLLSVQPYHRVERPYEELSAMCNAVSMIGSSSFAPWPSPRRPVAFGPCLVTTVADYRAAGGHAAARGDVVEDIALAGAYRRAGLAVTCWAGRGAVEFRMYPVGVRQLLDGWTKNMAAGAGAADPVGVLAGVWFVAACATAGVSAIVLVAGGGPADRSDVVAAVAMWVATTSVLRSILGRIGNFSWWTAILHPIPTAAFIAIFARSMWSTLVRRRVRWRGRVIPIGRGRTD